MSYFSKHAEVSELVGQRIEGVQESSVGDELVQVALGDGRTFVFGHWQDCCEHVWLDEGFEDLQSLAGSTVVSAEEVENSVSDSAWGTQTWTFYKIQTTTGFCTLRFCGESNGYYSEHVDMWWRE